MKESRFNIWVEQDSHSYLFNGLGGGLLRISDADRRDLKTFLGDPEAACSARLLYELIQGRMLVADADDELEILADRYHSSRFDTSHFALTIVTSLGCNFDCPYCFEAKHPSIIDAPVQQAILDVLDDQLPRLTAFDAHWFGGEPLIGKQPLLSLSDQFIERCDRAGVSYTASILTNGFLLDRRTCAQLQERRVRDAQISLDGPPEVHDRMRPQANGQGSFQQIVSNLHHAVEYLNINVRVNLDRRNISRAEELLQILEAEGLAGKLTVYPAQLVGIDDGAPSPSVGYKSCCLSNNEFAQAELQFQKLASQYGFAQTKLPKSVGAPCMAVRANELVVGSRGELYKCVDSVGNRLEVTGDIRDYHNPNGRLHKWLNYDPFADEECRNCIALPVCMGGCAHHAMDKRLYENRCSTFRHTYREQILAFVEESERKGAPVQSS